MLSYTGFLSLIFQDLVNVHVTMHCIILASKTFLSALYHGDERLTDFVKVKF